MDELRAELDDVMDRLQKNDRPELLKALELANKAHSEQARDDGTPYLAHPLRVALSLAWELYIWDPDLLCAALLHDAVEDNESLFVESIRKDFGKRVAHIVDVLTKPNATTREQINQQYFEDLLKAEEDYKLVKLADKLDNVRDAVNSPDLTKRRRAVAEARDFYLDLAKSLSDVRRRHTILALLQDAIKALEQHT